MDVVRLLIEFILHFDAHLEQLLVLYGAWTYVILFAIVFCESGFIIAPFLPGDALLFAAGAVSAFNPADSFHPAPLVVVLTIAAITGNMVNYWIGSWVGRQAFTGKLPLVKQSHLESTQAFYARYGGKTIVFARFVPVARTFAPFIAGIVKMRYRSFMIYNVVGALVWVLLFTIGGYLFGNIPVMREHFEIVIMAIILLSFSPVILHALTQSRGSRPVVASDAVVRSDTAS